MRVAICGKFDPVHDGHVDHIIKASEFGDYLYIITHSDDIVARTSQKGVCYVPFRTRVLLLEGLMLRLGIDGAVVQSVDTDGSVTETIRMLRPDVFVKGGDRVPGTLPENEVAACHEIGCKIVYGAGDLLNSSSRIVQGEENE